MIVRVAGTVAAVAVLAVAAPSAGAAIPQGNLLSDPGGEGLPGAPDASTVVAPPGWVPSGNFSLVQYGAPAFLTVADGARLDGGQNFFAGGPDSPSSAASQVVDVSAAAAEIDAGRVSATLSGQLGGFAAQADAATVTATFASGPVLQIGPVTPTERDSVTTLLDRSARVAVPAGTRQITVAINAFRQEGAYNDGYADNVALTLSTGAIPVFNKSVAVTTVRGTVLVKKPGGKAFAKLSGSEAIAFGSTVDTRRGKVRLSSLAKVGGPVQTADFYDGIFKVTQSGALTDLTLTEALAPCAKRGSAGAAAKKPKSRRLWGDGSGNFRTRGQYSSATVRGTVWLVRDACSGTLTKVKRGVVSVRDDVKRKTVTVRAGKSYTARAK